MREDRLEYYDPLYETITFEKGLPSDRAGFRLEEEDPLDPRDIIQTAEFARLAFLKQAGLAWLVFPSATHSRFAHSVGCWWLGRISETLIKVKTKGKRETNSLRTWLNTTKLREEFYLGLLLHDIGHGPLSHVLEQNDKFINGLQQAGIKRVDHEHRGALLFKVEGPLAKTWQAIVKKRYGSNMRTFVHVKRDLEKLKETVCLPAVCYLMTEDNVYLDKCSHPHKQCLPVVKDLITGVLDLDRLDHYARDSYFSGLHQISINLRGFLNNLKIILPEHESVNETKRALWALTEDGASYAASLLFNKRLLLSTMFRNPRSVAYHAMANWALTAYLDDLVDPASLANECLRIALMEDEQLLGMFGNARHEGCQYIGQSIHAMRPYYFVGKWSNIDIKVEHITLRNRLDNLVNTLNIYNKRPEVLIHHDEGFWEWAPHTPQDWLGAEWLI